LGLAREAVGVGFGDGDRGARIAQHERELIGPRERRERHGDRPELKRAKKCRDKGRRIAQHERDAVAAADATFVQQSGRAVLKRCELSVGQGVAAVPERRRTATAGRARGVGEGARQIERG
jgi:hypothetical protein